MSAQQPKESTNPVDKELALQLQQLKLSIDETRLEFKQKGIEKADDRDWAELSSAFGA